jgi:hypothetical protein
VVPDAALEFGVKDNVVMATAPRGTQKFQSLDPAAFPYWDKQVEDAKRTGLVPAARLAAALGYVKKFISDNEANEPNLCVTEVRNGILYATDRRAITLVRSAGLENVGLRIHGKSVSGFLTFLGTFPIETDDVEILEHDRSILMRRGDGALFGEALFQARFPDLPGMQMDEADHYTWTLVRDDVLSAIGFLTAGASWEENRIRLKEKDGKVTISMPNETGDTTEVTLDTKAATADLNALPIPADGFLLDHEVVTRILASWKTQEEVKLGICLRMVDTTGKPILRGYIRFVNEADGDKYLTIHSWLR